LPESGNSITSTPALRARLASVAIASGSQVLTHTTVRLPSPEASISPPAPSTTSITCAVS
jgi:hypothetical protein